MGVASGGVDGSCIRLMLLSGPVVRAAAAPPPASVEVPTVCWLLYNDVVAGGEVAVVGATIGS